MTKFTYYLNRPAPGNKPSNDVTPMQTNTNSISGLIAQDHIGFGVNNGGYHNVIHFQNQSGNPGAISQVGQLFTKFVNDGYGSDTALFFESGTGIIDRLTVNTSANIASPNGYVFGLNGFTFQWGKVNSGSTFSNGQTGTVTFISSGNLRFPTNNLGVFTSLISTGTPNGSASVTITSTSQGGFSWIFNSNSTQYTSFYWYAIGN